jgi:porphobilinogen synthase
MRQSEAARRLLRETSLSTDCLVMPLFVRGGQKIRAPIPSMPGQFQFSVDQLVNECQELFESRVPAVLLFGLPDGKKDEKGSGAYAKDGIIQRAVAAIKMRVPELLVITDVCLCAYTSHGHCGVVKTTGRWKVEGGRKKKQKRSVKATSYPPTLSERDFWIANDATLELLTKVAVSHAQAGSDMVAPSDMMDGNVGAIRRALDQNGFDRLPIMAYSAKFASSFYGPFREAVDSAPAFGDRRSYQMEIANADEALREAQLDIEEGADILMVKPALAYLDVIRRMKDAFHHPVAAFNVSGEYAMVKAAAARGWIAERPAWWEMLLAIKRAGADILITYWAKEATRLLRHS